MRPAATIPDSEVRHSSLTSLLETISPGPSPTSPIISSQCPISVSSSSLSHAFGSQGFAFGLSSFLPYTFLLMNLKYSTN